MTPQEIAREALIVAALSYQSTVMWSDAHPENPHSGASIELHEKMLDEAVREYVETLEAK